MKKLSSLVVSASLICALHSHAADMHQIAATQAGHTPAVTHGTPWGYTGAGGPET